jgi:hypothetical protein
MESNSINIFEVKLEILGELVRENSERLLKQILSLEDECHGDDEQRRVIDGISVLYARNEDGDMYCCEVYIRNEWEIAGVMFTHKAYIQDSDDYKIERQPRTYSLLYFCLLYLLKGSDICKRFIERIGELDKKYSEGGVEVSIDFDEYIREGLKWEGQIVKKSESILLVRGVWCGCCNKYKVFEVDRGDGRENAEVVMEILSRGLEVEITKVVKILFDREKYINRHSEFVEYLF